MAYCKHCGTELPDGSTVCSQCGASQVTVSQTPTTVNDDGGILWGLLGCCIPIVGLVLFLVWHDTKPNTAKAAGIGALVCVGAYFLFYLFFILLGVGMAGMAF